MIRFGPAGNCERFYQEGFKRSDQAPSWLAAQGLNAYEYSAGHGVTLGEAAARAIGQNAAACGVSVSIHAPYYINCASPDPAAREKSIAYLESAARAVDWMGGSRVVFHVGSPGKLNRDVALELASKTVLAALDRLASAGLSHILLCPETMGRPSQLGTLEETLALCASDKRLLPTLDFGHLHAGGLGALNTSEDFRRILNRMMEVLDSERAHHFHAHFSRIEYTAKGEKRHMCFRDAGYGPDFSHLAPLLLEYQMEPTLICESRGTQADDALVMLRTFEGCNATQNVID